MTSPLLVISIWFQIAQEHDTDTDIAGLLDEFDWYILPVANPDGYEYSHTTVSHNTQEEQPGTTDATVGILCNTEQC